MSNVDKLMVERGYVQYPLASWEAHRDHCRAWCLTISEDSGKRFVHVREWDLRHINPSVIKAPSYEVEMACETGIGKAAWTGKFYGISAETLAALLPEFEAKHGAIFTLLGGQHQ